jgi:hypothetical protein
MKAELRSRALAASILAFVSPGLASFNVTSLLQYNFVQRHLSGHTVVC